jgi:hypothetical protein
MKILHYFTPAVIIAVLVLSACEPIDKASNVPEIKFKSFTLLTVDTLGFQIKAGELTFSFIDGNADFGVNPNSADTLNLFLTPFKKVNMAYLPLNVDTFGRKYAVMNDPALVRIGQDKTVKGEIKLQIYYFVIPPFDTISMISIYLTAQETKATWLPRPISRLSDTGYWILDAGC